jgi:NADH-quinone oxidoreductase subunit A
MTSPYLALFILAILAIGFVGHMLVLAVLLGPKRHSDVKDDPFECGTIGSGSPSDRLSVKFYLVAMIFILFDIEIVFMYPWAVKLHDLGWFGFYTMLSFLSVLTIGLVYVWRRGVLDWN